jgi:hypothetical protein
MTHGLALVACIRPYDLVMGALFIFAVVAVVRAGLRNYPEDDS